MQEYADEGETKVYEVVGKVIKSRQYYDIDFQLGFIISYKEMEKDWTSKCMNLTYCHFFQETLINTSEYQVSRWENIKDKYASMTKQYLIKKIVG